MLLRSYQLKRISFIIRQYRLIFFNDMDVEFILYFIYLPACYKNFLSILPGFQKMFRQLAKNYRRYPDDNTTWCSVGETERKCRRVALYIESALKHAILRC